MAIQKCFVIVLFLFRKEYQSELQFFGIENLVFYTKKKRIPIPNFCHLNIEIRRMYRQLQQMTDLRRIQCDQMYGEWRKGESQENNKHSNVRNGVILPGKR